MKNVNEVFGIYTHNGAAHMDDVLSCCVWIAKFPHTCEIDRVAIIPERHSSRVIIDHGKIYDKHNLQFDHHQFERGDTRCALTLVLDYLGVLEDARKAIPQLQLIEYLDTQGPKAVCDKYLDGLALDKFINSRSLIEETVMEMFSKAVEINPQDILWQLMLRIGQSILNRIDQYKIRIAALEKAAHSIVVLGGKSDIRVVDVRKSIPQGTENPRLFLNEWCGNRYDVSVSWDERVPGVLSLFRFEGAPIDFSKAKHLSCVEFAHANGFCAKLKPGTTQEQLLEVITVSSV